MPLARFVLDLLNIIIWPLLVAASAFAFYIPISNLIDRVYHFKGPGFELGAEIQKDFQEEPLEENPPEWLRERFRELVTLREQHEQREQDVQALIRQLVSAEINLEMEKIYNRIFGSQIKLLEFLRNKKPTGQSLEMLLVYYKTVQVTNAPVFDDWSFNQYVGFLLSHGLIELREGNYAITQTGEAFLEYKSMMNYPSKGL